MIKKTEMGIEEDKSEEDEEREWRSQKKECMKRITKEEDNEEED